MKLIFGSDHAGRAGRQAALAAAREVLPQAECIDLGPDTGESVDYPDFAHRVAAAVAAGEADLGILVCSTGQGMAMAANRHPGARAALITDEFTARRARAHNNANIACFGELVLGPERIGGLLRAFLETPFEGGRHQDRVAKIECA